jgi:hypothetical protein
MRDFSPNSASREQAKPGTPTSVISSRCRMVTARRAQRPTGADPTPYQGAVIRQRADGAAPVFRALPPQQPRPHRRSCSASGHGNFLIRSPASNDARAAPCSSFRRYGDQRSAGENWSRPPHRFFGPARTVEPDGAKHQVIINRLAGLFDQFKPDWSYGLHLPHNCPVRRVAVRTFDFHCDDVTAAKLAVDREIERSQVAGAAIDLKFRPD